MTTLNEIQLANLALEHNLYVEGWQMKNLYLTMDKGGLGIHVLIKDEPVAACVFYLNDGMINVFVKEEHRGKGYGKQVIHETLEKYKITVDEVYGSLGSDISESFYNSCDIAYFSDGCFGMTKEEIPLLMEGKLTMTDVRDRRISEYKQNKLNNIANHTIIDNIETVDKNTYSYIMD